MNANASPNPRKNPVHFKAAQKWGAVVTFSCRYAALSVMMDPGNSVHRVRLENLHNFFKKSQPKRFITHKVRAFWNRPTKKIEIEKSRFFATTFSLKIRLIFFDLKNFEIFRSRFFSFSYNFQWKVRWKFSRFFDLKNFGRPISKCSNFFHNKPFWSRFFSKLCRFSWRTRWHRIPVEFQCHSRKNKVLCRILSGKKKQHPGGLIK